jgi:hypothetical protein
MAYYDYQPKEFREEFNALYEHAIRFSNKHDVPVEYVFEDLIIKNLNDYGRE